MDSPGIKADSKPFDDAATEVREVPPMSDGRASTQQDTVARDPGGAHAELDADLHAVKEVAAARAEVMREIEKRIVGQTSVVEHLLTAMFARGHCLFVGVPGLAKTMLISTLAETLNLSFNRIQFTPDLMPSDITGTDVLEEDQSTGRRVFRFIKGPVFANIVLADEINRTPPKTQAALLQSMQEYRVTAGGTTYDLDLPFLVFATQNPIEQEGTYPLPEAQLDRFMFQIDVDYPTEAEEELIVKQQTSSYRADINRVLSPERIRELQEVVLRVPVADHVVKYAVGLARATRPSGDATPDFIREYVAWGGGPRASQFLVLAGKARAILDGRFAVSVEDIRALAKPALQHRLILNYKAEAERVRASQLIERLIAHVGR